MSAISRLTDATTAYIAQGAIGPDEVVFAIQQCRRVVAAASCMERSNRKQICDTLSDLVDDVKPSAWQPELPEQYSGKSEPLELSPTEKAAGWATVCHY